MPTDRPCLSFIDATVEAIRLMPRDDDDGNREYLCEFLEEEVGGFVDRNLTPEEKRDVVSFYEGKHEIDLSVVYGDPNLNTRRILDEIDGFIAAAAEELLRAEILARCKKAGIRT